MAEQRPPRLVAFQHSDFRLLWSGQTVSTIGSQMQQVAIAWHVYKLLKGRSLDLELLGHHFHLAAQALGLGGIGLVRIVPVIIFALIGGVLAVVTLSGSATVAWLYLLTALSAAVTAFDEPAEQALIPHLVPKEHLANAISINIVQWQVGTIVGPALAGVVIAHADVGWVYLVNAVSFLAVVGALLAIRYRHQPGEEEERPQGFSWAALVEGLRYVHRSRLVWSTMLLDFWATFFSSARTMLPIIAGDVLKVGPQGYGLLATAQPAGAILAGAFLSLREQIREQGKVLLWSVIVYGAATFFFGVSSWFVLSYVMFALTGAADTVSTVIRATLRQLMTPDYLRGRMVSVNMMFFMGGPQLGELEAGIVASALGAPFAIASGGIATILIVAWIAWRYPRLRAYRGVEEQAELVTT